MNFFVIILSFISLLAQLAAGAPAVTSVHVSFVSGNKKTQYSHGTRTAPALVHYNLDSAGTEPGYQLHSLQRRSISKRPQESEPSGDVLRTTRRRLRGGQMPTSGAILGVTPTDGNTLASSSTQVTSEFPIPTSTTRSGTTTTKTKRRYRGPSPLTFRTTTGHATDSPPSFTTSHTSTNRHHKPSTRQTKRIPLSSTPTSSTRPGGSSPLLSQTSAASAIDASTQFPLRRLRSRIRFAGSTPSASSSAPVLGGSSLTSASTQVSSTMSTGSLVDDMSTTADIIKAEKKPKDTKAVKRSPFIENFESRGITFPDFDEFGGNEFGALRNFVGNGGSASVAAHSHANPESLSPDGVFLPPLPTEASDYSEDSPSHSDPYLADSETAKYAAQHPPFFAAFPHKRTVLDLNERRVEQGLEPNLLRSIRPFFAFFESANPLHETLGASHHHHQQAHRHPVNPYLTNPGKLAYGNDHQDHQFQSLLGHNPSSSSPHHHHISGNYVFNSVDDPSVLLYAQSLLATNPGTAVGDVAEAWSLFPHKRRRK